MNIQVDPTSSNLAFAVLNSKIEPRAVVGYSVKTFLPSPPNYITRSPGYGVDSGNPGLVTSLIWWKVNELLRQPQQRNLSKIQCLAPHLYMTQHILYVWNDYYRQFVIYTGMTVIVILGLLCPRTCGRRWKKKGKVASLDGIWTRNSQCEGTVVIHLPIKDQLVDNCTDHLSNIISIYKIIAE